MNAKNSAKLLLAFALSGMPFMQAYASSCGDISPLKDYLGDAYYDLDYAPASDAVLDDATLENLLASVDLDSGDGLRYRCLGADSKAMNPIEFDLENIRRLDISHGRTVFKAWENSKRKVKSASIELPKASQWQVSGDHVYTSSALFRSGIRSGVNLQVNPLNMPANPFNSSVFPFTNTQNELHPRSYLGELATTITARRGSVVITQTLYINGHKAEWVTWNLDS